MPCRQITPFGMHPAGKASIYRFVMIIKYFDSLSKGDSGSPRFLPLFRGGDSLAKAFAGVHANGCLIRSSIGPAPDASSDSATRRPSAAVRSAPAGRPAWPSDTASSAVTCRT